MQRQPEQQTALAQSHTSKASTTFPLESIAPFDAVFAQEPTPAQIELSIYLCTDDQIRLLNKHYRSTDESTDVLSFPQQQLRLLGDVVISIETAKRQATGHLRDELRILLLHGILHLLGFDHEIDEARYETFRQLEQKMMRILGWRGNGLILDHQVQLGNECSEE
jgi:rRNA maturation RNase YbeY